MNPNETEQRESSEQENAEAPADQPVTGPKGDGIDITARVQEEVKMPEGSNIYRDNMASVVAGASPEQQAQRNIGLKDCLEQNNNLRYEDHK